MSEQSTNRGNERSGRLGRFLQRTGADGAEGTGDGDPLTGLATRQDLLPLVEQAVANSIPASARAVVAFADIGLLRDVNDSYGPDVGDELLRQVAGRLQAVDVPGAHTVRYGGAEFAMVFERVRQPEHADEIGRFLVEALSSPFELGPAAITIEPTVGLALTSDTHAAPADVVRDAHQALVRARDVERGTFLVYDDARRGRFNTRIDEERIRKAIEKDEFLLHYQPIVRTDDGSLVGVEALLRWSAPEATNTGVLHPHDFMPLLEKSGLGVQVGEIVLRKGCAQLAEWGRMAPDRPKLFLTCNLGARQLAEPGFAQTVVGALQAADVLPWQLCLDITEDALRHNRSGTWGSLRDLKDLGVKLGLDDFGTGMASLIWLRELQLDLLHVDRVFTHGLGASLSAGFGMDNADAVLVRHIVSLAHDLGLVTVAEGVETPVEADALTELGVDMAQGYHFGRPVPVAEISELIAPGIGATDDTWDPSQVLEGGS